MVAACPFPLARGTPVRIQRMAESLAARGHEVHVITYHLGSQDANAAYRVHRIRELKSYQKLSPGPSYKKLLFVDLVLVRKLRKVLSEIPFDVIHAHHYEGVLVAAAARTGHSLPLVYDAHTLLMSELPYYPLGLPKGLMRTLGRWMDRGIPRLANHTVCVTETIERKLVRDAGANPARVSVIANGVEFEEFAAASAARRIPAGRRLIFTGNLAGYQGIDFMLRAFARVPGRVPGARLAIVSDSSFEPYEALAHELGIREAIDVIPAPPFAEMPALLADGDIAINPRVDCDGVPVKLLNYMAAARPVVSFDSSAPGVVHGETGWLAESGNTEALAQGMIALLENPQLGRRLGEAGQAFVRHNHRWPVVAERCETLYRKLMAAPR
jgi:glycosyltransferase involved in cell wall biosynthesis